MVGTTRHGLLSRVRSNRKLRTTATDNLNEDDTQQHTYTYSHRRNQSDTTPLTRSASLRADYKGHYPPIEWDPLKLNPPVPDAPTATPPARLHERQPLPGAALRTKRSFAGHESRTMGVPRHHRRPERLHRSDSGFALGGVDAAFDFALERDKALQVIDRNRQREAHDVHMKGWPSPASSVDSGKSWFEDDDEDDSDSRWGGEEDYEEEAPSPQRRPQVGSPNDPGYFLKRGAWKRRGIFFGVRSEEVYQKDDDAFDI